MPSQTRLMWGLVSLTMLMQGTPRCTETPRAVATSRLMKVSCRMPHNCAGGGMHPVLPYSQVEVSVPAGPAGTVNTVDWNDATPGVMPMINEHGSPKATLGTD